MPLTIACVLRSGGIYDARWVERLRDGVARHLQSDYRFVCLSDVAVPCERIALEHDWPGWWAKIETFKLPGPVLYFDLDTAIVGDITEAMNARAAWWLTALRDFYRPNGLGSGVMLWGGDMKWIYEKFAASPNEYMRECLGGDQDFLERTVNLDWVGRWQDVLPAQIVSYKVHCRNGIPPDARVVCLHGRPKFADMPPHDPVRLAWEMGGVSLYRSERGLCWPASDVNCAPAVFATISDLDHAYRHCRGFGVAVQAGGNCGVWPAAMGEKFRLVYTFEPDPINFRCLCANAPGENIFKFNAALGEHHALVGLDIRPDNVGAHQIDGSGDIPTLRIDDLSLHACDLIYLDIEGFELPALRGAQETITRCRPVITIEDKGMSERYVIKKGDAVAWLEARDYRVAQRIHRDVILVPSV